MHIGYRSSSALGNNETQEQYELSYYSGYGVLQNCSLIWCEQTKLAALVDPGGDAEKIKQEVAESGVTLMQILLDAWVTLTMCRRSGGAGTALGGVPVIVVRKRR